MTRILALISLLGLAAVLLAAFDRVPGAAPGAADAPAGFDFAAPLPDASVYHLGAAWATDGGDTLALADLRGRPVALAMVYSECGTACPLLVHDLKRLGRRAGDVGLRYVLVSLAPERDTPERFARFRAAHALGDDWTLLRGDPADVQTLAAVLGVRYRADQDGTIAHSNLITLLTPGGEIAAQQEGLGTDPAPAVAALQTTLTHP